MSAPSVPPPPPPPAAPDAGPREADPLVAFLAGKRASERQPCHVPAVLEGSRGPAAATVLDLSGDGALVQIDDPAFREAEARGGMHAYFDLVQVHAAGDLALVFPSHALRVPVTVVRWTAGCAGSEPSRVGLRLRRTLSEAELHALRSGTPLSAAVPAVPAPTPPAPTHVPRRGERLAVLVFHALKPELGPLAAGRAVAFGHGLAMMRIEGSDDASALAARLSSGALFAAVLRGGLTAWEGRVRLGPVLHAPSGGALDVALTTQEPWPPELERRLRRG